MKIKVNQDACIGCGACQAIAEELFEINDEGLSTTIMDVVPENLEEKAIEAIQSCPTEAIFEVKDDNDNDNDNDNNE